MDQHVATSLISRICELGNGDAWKEFASIYEPVILRFIQRHGLQSADAEEISQEVLSRVFKSISTWDGGQQQSTFRGWLYRITRNLTLDFLRKRKGELARTDGQEGGLSRIHQRLARFKRNTKNRFSTGLPSN